MFDIFTSYSVLYLHLLLLHFYLLEIILTFILLIIYALKKKLQEGLEGKNRRQTAESYTKGRGMRGEEGTSATRV